MKRKRIFSGQSLVEFALIFPIAFFLITGFLDLGRAVFYYSLISNSVREGTRYAIVNKRVINISEESKKFPLLTAVVKDYSFGIPKDDLQIGIILTRELDNYFRDNISITAKYMFEPITPGIKHIFGNKAGIELIAQSTMRIEPIAR